MTNPINPGLGAPAARPTTEPRPKATQPAGPTFSVSGEASGDSVATRGSLSFGSLAPLVKTDLNSDSAVITAQQLEKLLNQEPLPVVNNRPQVITSLYESLLKEKG